LSNTLTLFGEGALGADFAGRIRMITNSAGPAKLYLLQLSATTVPLPAGGKMEMIMAAYLIVTGDGKHILIDSGMYPETLPPGLPPSRDKKNVLEHLAELRVAVKDIDIVICTHFDVDHAGYHDAFASAEFIVQRRHYEIARGGHPRYAAARAHWDHPALRYRLIDGDTELLPGLSLIETSGHAPGHQSVVLKLPNAGAVLLAIDAVVMQRCYTPERKAWPKDDNEAQLRASTRKLMDIAEREQAQLVVFGHDGEQWQSLRRAPEFYE
jgi:N-acyl homoserine lactone hydrolase